MQSSRTEGILDIELLPRPEQASITARLAYTISRAQVMRAAVAYWTVGPDEVSDRLALLLSHPESYLCVDIHIPTNLDQLDLLNEHGGQLWLHLRHLSTHTETLNRGLPQHLMHAKTLLFDLLDGTAEIWVGSHNWTTRALCGPNIEESLVIRVQPTSHLYADTVESLNHIRSLCTRFRHEQLPDYKRLQDDRKTPGSEPVPTLELEGDNVEALHGAITLFSTKDSESDWEALRKIQETVYLNIIDLRSNRSFIYSANILHSGLQPGANRQAGGLGFSERRYAVIDGRQRPLLQPASIPSTSLLESSAHFVTLELHEMLDTAIRFAPVSGRQARWVQSPHDPLVIRTMSEPVNDDQQAMEQLHPSRLRERLERRPLDMKIPAFLAPERPDQQLLFDMAEPQKWRSERSSLIQYRSLVDSRQKSSE